MTTSPGVESGRMAAYRIVFQMAADAGQKTLTSEQIGRRVGVHPSAIRRDMMTLGGAGKRGVGYNVAALLHALPPSAFGGAALLIAAERETLDGNHGGALAAMVYASLAVVDDGPSIPALVQAAAALAAEIERRAGMSAEAPS